MVLQLTVHVRSISPVPLSFANVVRLVVSRRRCWRHIGQASGKCSCQREMRRTFVSFTNQSRWGLLPVLLRSLCGRGCLCEVLVRCFEVHTSVLVRCLCEVLV